MKFQNLIHPERYNCIIIETFRLASTYHHQLIFINYIIHIFVLFCSGYFYLILEQLVVFEIIYESFISLYFKPADNVDGAAYQNTQSVVSMLSRLTMLQPTSLIDHEDLVVNLLPKMLEPDTPRKVQMLTCKLWMKLNIVIPRR